MRYQVKYVGYGIYGVVDTEAPESVCGDASQGHLLLWCMNGSQPCEIAAWALNAGKMKDKASFETDLLRLYGKWVTTVGRDIDSTQVDGFMSWIQEQISPNPVIPTEEMRRILGLCVEWYRMDGNECGGCLHVVLDDDNVTDWDLQWCRDQTADKRAHEILDGLGRLTVMQRKWVTYNIYGMLEGEGEREVLEEDDDD